MHKKISEKTQIIFIDNLIINPQFIGSQQTHHKKELHHMDQSKDGMIIVLKIKERDFHLGTDYGPVGLW